MAPTTLSTQWRSFWHTLTSNDRHASHDSPYRTGQHVPLSQSKHSSLNANTPSASASRVDLAGFDHDVEAGRGFRTNSNNGTPKQSFTASRQNTLDSKADGVQVGEIQMQNFNDGQPPPPPPSHSWKRIDRFLEDNYEELFEQVGEPATFNDVNEMEHELDCTLPQEVRESLQIHDGQERGGRPTGVIFGCMLLDCEEIIQEWNNWRTVNEAYFSNEQRYDIPQAPIKAFAGSSSAVPLAQPHNTGNSHWRQELLDKQDSQPTNAVQKVYAHPAWIPLARDWGGNNIAVDLAPGPAGRWGQVILMGRDFDCKYVVSKSWGHFLATLADDMDSGRWWIEDDTRELKLRAFKQPGVEPAYIDILRWRSDQKHGRKIPKRKPGSGPGGGAPLHINSQVPSGNFSPYQSPTTDDRGRSPHRLSNGKAPAASSPRGHISSPLARVAEESSQPSNLRINTESSGIKNDSLIGLNTPVSEKLIGLDSPGAGPVEDDTQSARRPSFPKSRLSSVVNNNTSEESSPVVAKLTDATNAGAAHDIDDGELKTVHL